MHTQEPDRELIKDRSKQARDRIIKFTGQSLGAGETDEADSGQVVKGKQHSAVRRKAEGG